MEFDDLNRKFSNSCWAQLALSNPDYGSRIEDVTVTASTHSVNVFGSSLPPQKWPWSYT